MSNAASAARLAPGVAANLALAAVARLVAPLPGARLLGPLGAALVLGIALRGIASWKQGGLPARLEPGTRYAARTLLRLGVVLMGARLDFGLVGRAGLRILALDLLVVTAGLLGVVAVARRLGVERGLALLLAAGSSICGASAIAAVAPVARAREDEVSVSVGVVTLLGTLGVLAFTLVGNAVQAEPVHYGVLAGASLQEVAQALAAAMARGPAAGDAATLAKLTRVLLLAPVVVAIGLAGRERGSGLGLRALLPPAFVTGFLAVGVLRSLGAIPAALVGPLTEASIFLMVVAMGAIGLGVDLAAIRRTGPRALALGSVGAVLALGLAFAGTFALGL